MSETSGTETKPLKRFDCIDLYCSILLAAGEKSCCGFCPRPAAATRFHCGEAMLPVPL